MGSYRLRFVRSGYTTGWYLTAATPAAATLVTGTVNASVVTANDTLAVVDTTPPTVNCSIPPGDSSTWRTTEVTGGCSAFDSGSGLNGPSSFGLSTNVGAGNQTSTATIPGFTVCDRLSNCVSYGPFGTWKVDRKGPTYSCQAPNTTSWFSSNAQIMCVGRDDAVNGQGSGIQFPDIFGIFGPDTRTFYPSTNLVAGQWNANASTSPFTICDKVGNCTTVPAISGLKVDKAAPSISCPSPPAVWSADNFGVTCSTADPGSGLATGPTGSFTVSTLAAPGSEGLVGTGVATVCDVVSNCITTTPLMGFKVDRKAPTLTLDAPAQALVVRQGDVVTPSVSCNDGGSGVASCATTPIDTSVPGTFTWTGTTVDGVGNTTSASRTYTVQSLVRGVVTDGPSGAPAAGVNVRLWPVGASSHSHSTLTAADGSYQFVDVPNGSYQVQFAKAGTYPTRWFDHAGSRAAARVVTVGAGGALVVDSAMGAVAGLGGVVVDRDTLAPVAGATVTVHVAGGAAVATATTGADGSWRLQPLAPGSYEVQYAASGRDGEWHLDAATRAASTPVVVAPGAFVSLGADLASTLPPSVIRGRVTVMGTGAALAGANVRAWVPGATAHMVAVKSAADGTFTMTVPPGTYEIQVALGGYSTRWWVSGATRAGAVRITLGDGGVQVADIAVPRT